MTITFSEQCWGEQIAMATNLEKLVNLEVPPSSTSSPHIQPSFFMMNPDQKITIDWFDRADMLLKLSSPVLTAKHFILKTSKYNPACVSLLVVPADFPSFSPPLLHAIFSCPQDPRARVCHFLPPSPPPLPSVWLCCSPRGCLAPRHRVYSGRRHKGEMGAAESRKNEYKKGPRRLHKTIASCRFSPWTFVLVRGMNRRITGMDGLALARMCLSDKGGPVTRWYSTDVSRRPERSTLC